MAGGWPLIEGALRHVDVLGVPSRGLLPGSNRFLSLYVVVVMYITVGYVTVLK
jgi:hypothetical protein